MGVCVWAHRPELRLRHSESTILSKKTWILCRFHVESELSLHNKITSFRYQNFLQIPCGIHTESARNIWGRVKTSNWNKWGSVKYWITVESAVGICSESAWNSMHFLSGIMSTGFCLKSAWNPCGIHLSMWILLGLVGECKLLLASWLFALWIYLFWLDTGLE